MSTAAPQNDGLPSQVATLQSTDPGLPPAAPSTGAAPDAARTGPVPAAAPASSPRDFLRSLESAFTNLVTLRVVTIVGAVSVDGTVVTPLPGGPVEAASTEINLLDGDIVNVLSPGFAEAGGSLQVLHQTQVEKSNAILMANLAALQSLATSVMQARR